MSSESPTLNWRELEALASLLKTELDGTYAERVSIPVREYFPGGFIKDEWCIEFSGKKSRASLLISIRPRHPYLGLYGYRELKPNSSAPEAPFLQFLAKKLRGSKLHSIDTPKGERMITLWFSENGEKMGLVLFLIPARPQALLINSVNEILAQSTSQDLQSSRPFAFPSGANAPLNLEVRTDLVTDRQALPRLIESSLEKEALQLRVNTLSKELRLVFKTLKTRLQQSETALAEAEREPDWKKYGELLKATLPSAPQLNPAHNTRTVMDFETDTHIDIPCDPKLSAKDQVEKYFQNSRRKIRRKEEAQARMSSAQEKLERIQQILKTISIETDWKGIETLEKEFGITTELPTQRKRKTGWLGKSFVSKDGIAIWVGRSKDENLELTFKHSRGNDLWFHVRGRPGAHVLIPFSSGKQAGKSVPLETLLDAATLAAYYSGGEKWGKTEVDYTFKKNVKRIKDSTEVSYHHNKTLMIEIDPTRIQRLLGT